MLLSTLFKRCSPFFTLQCFSKTAIACTAVFVVSTLDSFLQLNKDMLNIHFRLKA